MNTYTARPYGSWKSPITSDVIVSGSVTLDHIVLDGENIFWTESRPSEGGRNVIVRRSPHGEISDITPTGYNARTRVHEYGGGVFTVHDGAVYFSNFSDNHLYRQSIDDTPQRITSQDGMRYADFIVDANRNELISVCEDHSVSDSEPKNSIVRISLTSGTVTKVLVQGNDFYSNPTLSPDGTQFTWLTWNHPNMPWDGTELWVATVNDDGALVHPVKVAGGVEESIFQPEWSPQGVLYFVSDTTDWWNLYRYRDGKIEVVTDRRAEFGAPQWVFGISKYAFLSESQILCTFTENGVWRLATVDTRTKELQLIENSFTYIDGIRASGQRVVFKAASADRFPSLFEFDVKRCTSIEFRKSSDLEIDAGYLSLPTSIEFRTEGGLTAHGFYYPPKNKDFIGTEGELPPLLVHSHGGPTSAYDISLELGVQYWTSRGFAVLNVNYGGSTGYGRPYRERLKGNWGVVDVDDCVNGAKYLVDEGVVDGERIAIAGGSAGGYTTLCALTFRDTFRAGASHFGLSDLEVFVCDTHKFEARYLDSLIGPYPERKDLYYGRSAIHFTNQLSCPIIFFQGLDDKVVPPNQAERMVDALKGKGLPVAYLAFEGEGHGFRMAANIKRSLDGEFYFYSRVFGFEIADDIDPVEIINL